MIYLHTYNETLKSVVASGMLITSLLTGINTVIAKDSKKQMEQKAKLSVVDVEQLNIIIKDILSKNYEIYKDCFFSGDKFLLTYGTGIKLLEALNIAENDTKIKLKYLGNKGNNKIYVVKLMNTYHVIMITELNTNISY